jgi:hypothetical protein
VTWLRKAVIGLEKVKVIDISKLVVPITGSTSQLVPCVEYPEVKPKTASELDAVQIMLGPNVIGLSVNAFSAGIGLR